MNSTKVQFLTTQKDFGFIMKSPNEDEVNDFVDDLYSIFGNIEDDGTPTINALQQYTQSVENGLTDFIQKYRTKLPQLNALSAFLSKLNQDEYFIFLPNVEVEQIDFLKIREYLNFIVRGEKYTKPSDKLIETYNDLLGNYRTNLVGHERISIGNRKKEHRICRFCKRDSNTATFNNKAHAISEALGNKNVILFDECDNCNKNFSETIEPDIINILSLFRTMFGIKGKGGNKKIKGKNFDLKKEEDQVKIHFNNIDDRPDPNDDNYKLKLNLHQPLISQNVYKSLCKYFLSVIDEKQLAQFSKTIEWIRGNIEVKELPKIAELTTYDFFTFHPKLNYYIRRNKNTKLPFAVCEFRFTCKVLVFIVPLFESDEKDFTNDIDYENFWKFFKHYNKYDSWIFNDYSNNTPREFTLNLDFQIGGKDKEV